MLSFFLSGTDFLNKHWNWPRAAPWRPQMMAALRDVHESLGKKIKPSGNLLTAGSESLAIPHVGLHLLQTWFRKPSQQILPCKGLFWWSEHQHCLQWFYDVAYPSWILFTAVIGYWTTLPVANHQEGNDHLISEFKVFLYKYIDPLSYLLAESSSARETGKLAPGFIVILVILRVISLSFKEIKRHILCGQKKLCSCQWHRPQRSMALGQACLKAPINFQRWMRQI